MAEGGQVERGQRGHTFDFLGLTAKFAYEFAGSVSYDVGRTTPLRFGKSDDPGMNSLNELLNATTDFPAFHVLGWIDVHHPCEGHIKARLRVGLPAARLPPKDDPERWNQLHATVLTVFRALGIPEDETYEAYFCVPEQATHVENPVDRDGMTDRLY